MKPKIATLKTKDIITLVGVIIVGFGWLLVDQIFLPESYQRFIALFVILLALFYFQFRINQPANTIQYSHSLALICVSFIVVMSIVIDLIIKHNFTIKSILIWILAGSLPYLSGFVYTITKRIR